MIIREAKDIAHQWVIQEVSQQVGFQGAFYHGSVNWLTDDAILPPTSDLDIMLIFDEPPSMKLGKFIYQGLMLEVSYLSWDDLGTPEQVLAQHHMAGSFQGPSIIADPIGRLTQLQVAVSQSYAKQKWVYRRCENTRDKVLRVMNGVQGATEFYDKVTSCLFSAGLTTHMLLVAGLKNPTVRRRYSAVQELLTEYDHLDFYESLLETVGCQEMTASRVQYHLTAVAAAFDAAKTIRCTPYKFAADLTDIARPVAIDGSQALIDAGFHREAIFWMVATYSRCQWIFDHDATTEVQAQFDIGYGELLADLNLSSFTELEQRCEIIKAQLSDVWMMAESIMDRNPGIDRVE